MPLRNGPVCYSNVCPVRQKLCSAQADGVARAMEARVVPGALTTSVCASEGPFQLSLGANGATRQAFRKPSAPWMAATFLSRRRKSMPRTIITTKAGTASYSWQ
ncbi:uncharacterized protein LOC144109436 [Amblyomma americanum]